MNIAKKEVKLANKIFEEALNNDHEDEEVVLSQSDKEQIQKWMSKKLKAKDISEIISKPIEAIQEYISTLSEVSSSSTVSSSMSNISKSSRNFGICPISIELGSPAFMVDPVFVNGKHYERRSIVERGTCLKGKKVTDKDILDPADNVKKLCKKI